MVHKAHPAWMLPLMASGIAEAHGSANKNAQVITNKEQNCHDR
jgi:hypothetical protein